MLRHHAARPPSGALRSASANAMPSRPDSTIIGPGRSRVRGSPVEAAPFASACVDERDPRARTGGMESTIVASRTSRLAHAATFGPRVVGNPRAVVEEAMSRPSPSDGRSHVHRGDRHESSGGCPAGGPGGSDSDGVGAAGSGSEPSCGCAGSPDCWQRRQRAADPPGVHA
jgi:hypothetical protein